MILPQTKASELAPMTNVPLKVNVSASQVKLYDRCARLWWLNYVASVRERRLQHFILGTALHSVGERFLLGHAKNEADLYPPNWNKGLTEDESVWVNRATRHAIETGVWQLLTDSYVEFPILFLTGNHHLDARGLPLLAAAKTYDDEQGVRKHTKPDTLIDGSALPLDWDASPPFVGFIDLLKLGQDPAIIDHKTAKTRRYATTAAKLAEDAQVLSYAALPMVLDPAITSVRLRHNIFLKSEDTKIAYAVDATAPFERVLAQWEHNRAVATEMVSLRAHFPKTQGVSPFHRAKNWLKVRSAIDEGRPDACNDYGGCPFRDACSGRCSVESVVQRLDAPAPPGHVQVEDDARVARTFGINYNIVAKPKPQPPHPKDSPMFAALKMTAGIDAYVVDPSNPTQQYRCRLITEPDAQGIITIALWPDANVQPAFESLGDVYRTDVPVTALMSVPSIAATITGYAAELARHPEVTAEQAAWSAAAPPSPLAASSAAKIANRDAPDNRFGIVGVGGTTTPAITQATTATVGAPVRGTAATITKPAPTTKPPATPAGFVPVSEGAVVRVAATDHPFWSNHKGKLAKVATVLPGDTEGTYTYTVEIGGHPYPDVDAMRFELVPVAVPATPHELTPSLPSKCMGLVGQNVSVRMQAPGADTPIEINARLDSADMTTGIVMLNGGIKAKYEEIVSIELLVESSIPGVKTPKGPGKVLENIEADSAKSLIKATKEQAKQAKAEAKAPAVAATDAPVANALRTAMDLVDATLSGGKVTRKVLESIQPLLANAMEYQTKLESQLVFEGAPPVAAPLNTEQSERLTKLKETLEEVARLLA